MAKKKKTTSAETAEMDWDSWHAAHAKKLAEKKKKYLRAVKDFAVELHGRGITQFSVSYSGEGDSGDVSDTDYMKHASFGAKKITDIKEQERQALIDAAWVFIPEGFENNEGGYGTVVFDFVNSTISIEHNTQYTDVNTTESRFNFDGDNA